MRLIVLILSIHIFSSFNRSNEVVEIGDVQFVKIKKGLYASKYEVTNGQYQEFVLENGSNLINQVYSEGWTEGEEFQKSYFKGPKLFYATVAKFKNNPVVNVTQSGSGSYAEWFALEYENELIKKFTKSVIRLPTVNEYKTLYNFLKKIDISLENLAYNPPIKKKGEAERLKELDVDINNITVEDFQNMEYRDYLYKEWIPTFLTWPVHFYYNNYKPPIYHLFGNVSEWTNQTNIAYGGNWMTEDESKIRSAIHCETYSPKIGFRLVLEVIEE